MNFYYLNTNQDTIGPVTEDDLPLLYEKGEVNEETLVAVEGGDEWFPLKTIIETVEETPAVVSPPPSDPMPMAAATGPMATRATRQNTTAAPQLRRAQPPTPSMPRQPNQGWYRPNVSPVIDPTRMPGIGRLGFFGVNTGVTLLILIMLLLLFGGAFLSAMNKSEEGMWGFIIGLIATYAFGFFGAQVVFIISCFHRAKNIGWSPWLTVVACILLFPINGFIGMILQTMPTGYVHTRKLDATAKVLGTLFISFILVSTLFVLWVMRDASRPVWPGRDEHVTQLTRTGPSPQPYENEDPPEGVQVVTYPSGDLQLKAWYAKPNKPGKQPALVYFHGGYAFGVEDFEVVESFIDAGFAVMTPMLRGENGNPGAHEHYYGERDDAEAAIRWMKLQPEVDPNRVVTFGHSAGGVLSAMVSLRKENDVLLTGSSGGMYEWRIFKEVPEEELPFDPSNWLECRLRSPAEHAGFIQIPHVAYIGNQDRPVIKGGEIARRAAERTQAPLTIVSLNGDHNESLAPAVEAFLTLAKSKTGL